MRWLLPLTKVTPLPAVSAAAAARVSAAAVARPRARVRTRDVCCMISFLLDEAPGRMEGGAIWAKIRANSGPAALLFPRGRQGPAVQEGATAWFQGSWA